MTTVYLVVQQGVHRHDIRGVYTTREKAETAAIRSAREDKDDYHEWIVCETGLDTYTEDVLEITSYQKGKL